MSRDDIWGWVTVDDDDGQEHQLGFDGDGRLYWDKKRVLTEQKIALPKLVEWMIVAGGGSTVILMVVAVLEYCGG